MKKFGDFIVKNKVIILLIGLIALIPSIIGMINTKINYDILVYLPDDIETMKGQKILSDDFNLGSFSISILDNMSANEALSFEKQVKNVKGVNNVVSLYDVIGTQIPLEMLPEDVQSKVAKENSTLLLITFKDSISDEITLKAVDKIRDLAKAKAKIAGMSAMVLDTKNLSDSEVTTYVIIAVICCIFVLMLALDSYAVPFLLLLNIGIAVLYNMGSNVILGNISYITKAISSILQLGVTTDFSIFLYHQYEHEKIDAKDKNEAMSKAIGKTLNSIIGSSTTTIAGFLALCTMQLTLGKDIGIVMAKGVLFGVITVVTIFPSLILIFDKIITKFSHKPIIPKFTHLNNFIVKRYKWIFAIFLILLIPAWWCQKNTEVYYNLDRSLPTTLSSSIANSELEKKYNLVSPMIVLASKDSSNEEINNMINEIKKMDHIDLVLSASQLSDLNIPDEMINKDIKSIFESDKYELILINSTYEKATTQLNNQINDINTIVKKYNKKSIVAGEGALTKDLVEISNTDFNNVSYASIGVILIIIILVLKSYTLPILLIVAIEFAIFINMGIPYLTGTTIPFVSSIVIGTIQLGATIDYAILMTNKYLEKRKSGADKYESVKHALNSSVSSIFISGMCFFAATFGVGVYSDLEMVGSLCSLIARGAIISMLVVILILPSLLLIFDKIITKTTSGFKKGDNKNMKKNLKLALIAILTSLFIPYNVQALIKDETVYVKANNTGEVTKTIVSEHLINSKNDTSISDFTNLTDLTNTNGKETFKLDGNSLTWNSTGNDIYYKGLTNKSIPISMKISYKFNGKEYDKFDDINGKSGHVKINVKLTNNEKHGSIYTPFTVILGANMDNETNTNLKVNNGTILSNGKNSIIAGIAMPGLSESLDLSELSNLNEITIEYDTTSFATNEMYAIITPKFLDMNSINTELNKLYTNMDTLNNSSTALVVGSKKIYNGANELNTKYKEYNTGMNALNSGTKELYSKYASIDNGISQINNEVNKLEPLLEELGKINDTVQELNEKAQAINSDELNAEINKLVTMVNEYSTLVKNDLTTLATAVCTPSSEENPNPQYNETTCNSIKEITTKLKENGIDESTLEELNKKISSLTNSANELKDKSQAVADKFASATETIQTAKKSINALNSGSKLFNEKLGYVSSSLNTLTNYSNQIYEGTTSLENGSKDLYEGMSKFDTEGIKVLYDTINNTIKNKANTLQQLNSLSNDYNSFGGSSSNIKSSTKFIVQISK